MFPVFESTGTLGSSFVEPWRSEQPRATHSQRTALKEVLSIPDLDASAKASIQEYLDRVAIHRLMCTLLPPMALSSEPLTTREDVNIRVQGPSAATDFADSGVHSLTLFSPLNIRRYSLSYSQSTSSTDSSFPPVIPCRPLSQCLNAKSPVFSPLPPVPSIAPYPSSGLHDGHVFTQSPFSFVPGHSLTPLPPLFSQPVIRYHDFLAPPPTHRTLEEIIFADARYGPMRENPPSDEHTWSPVRQVDPVVDDHRVYDLYRSRQLDGEAMSMHMKASKEEIDVENDPRRSLQSSDGTLSLRLLSKLGEGGYGKVMLAWCAEMNRRVAVKVLHKAAYEEWNGGYIVELELEVMKSVTQLFEQEQEGGSAFLLKILKSWQDETNVYFVLDHYSHDMKNLTASRSRVALHDIRLYAAELVLALESLHGLRILHRDIKPENILISPTGHVCLADFGLAKTFPRLKMKNIYKRALKSYDRVGTSGYMAPEIIQNYVPATGRLSRGSGVEADIWSLGVTLLELIIGNGRSFFDGGGSFRRMDADEEEEVLDHNVQNMPLDLEKWVDDLDARHLLGQMLDRNPKTRATLKQIKDHPFFECLNWKKVARREYTPQYVPSYIHSSLEPFPSCAFSTFYSPRGICSEDISPFERQRLALRNLRKMQRERGELMPISLAVEWNGKMVLDALHETVASNAGPLPMLPDPCTRRRAPKRKPVPVFKRWFESLNAVGPVENVGRTVRTIGDLLCNDD